MTKKTITIVYNTSVYVYKFRMNLIKEIQKLGYEVVIISPIDEYVEKFKEVGVQHYHINMSQYGMNPFSELKTTYEIYKAFKKYNPVYSLHYTIKPNIFGGIAARFANVKVINNIAGTGKAFSKDGLFQKFIQNLYRIGLKKSVNVFFQNHDDMNLFLDNKIVKKELAYRIPGSGVDLITYKYSPINNNITEFLFIGRLLKEKGIEFFLEAATTVLKYTNSVKFTIVGEHVEENVDYIDIELFKNYIKHPSINYVGTVSPDRIPSLIKASSCVVLPSYYREGVPRSLLEAASIGRVIITTNNIGCKEVVEEDKNGFKCNIKDAICLSKKMITFIELSLEEKKIMGRYSREKMEKEFDEKIVLDTYIKAILRY